MPDMTGTSTHYLTYKPGDLYLSQQGRGVERSAPDAGLAFPGTNYQLPQGIYTSIRMPWRSFFLFLHAVFCFLRGTISL